ncbi:carbohydrate deacetylase [Geothermobacter hydrogeniphilus]|nr:ChbG/HpnK family deacetylase [Geothermobacter hydrogeniphilus]
MRRLIVNADDFGAGSATDRGILQAFRRGIVTSASLLANAPHTSGAAIMAEDAGLPVGVHLNLADGYPLTGPIPGLSTGNGRFPGKKQLRRILISGPPEPDAVRRELAAQIERIMELGLTPDHIDTHQHFFLFPSMTGLVLDLAGEYDIRALRMPLPAEDPADDPEGALGEELALYRRLAPALRKPLEQRSIRTPRGLFGMPRLNRFDRPALEQIIRQLPPGNWELMVHPGHVDRENPFGGPPREVELQALLGPHLDDLIAQHGIRLIDFGALQ